MTKQNIDNSKEKKSKKASFEWSAPEFIYFKKTNIWYAYLVGITILVEVGYHFLSKDFVTPVLIVLIAYVFGYYGGKKPDTIKYVVNNESVQINGKVFYYETLKSYSIHDFGNYSSMNIIPVKRFAPLRCLNYKTEDEEKIIKIIENQLPLDNRKEDIVDKFTRLISF